MQGMHALFHDMFASFCKQSVVYRQHLEPQTVPTEPAEAPSCQGLLPLYREVERVTDPRRCASQKRVVGEKEEVRRL